MGSRSAQVDHDRCGRQHPTGSLRAVFPFSGFVFAIYAPMTVGGWCRRDDARRGDIVAV